MLKTQMLPKQIKKNYATYNQDALLEKKQPKNNLVAFVLEILEWNILLVMVYQLCEIMPVKSLRKLSNINKWGAKELKIHH